MSYNFISLPEFIPWISLVISVIIILVLVCVFVWFFRDPKELAIIPLLVTITSISIILVSVVLIPLDIFTISQEKDPTITGIVIRILYYVAYFCVLVFCFLLIPFAYFYYEESDEDTTILWRIIGALKYTVFTVVAGVIIVIVALVLRIFGDPSIGSASQWVKHVFDVEHFGDSAIGFIISCLALIGLIFWNVYTAYGLAALPIGLIKGNRGVVRDISEIEEEIEMLNEKIASINAKYEMSQKKMSRRDRKELTSSKGKRRLLDYKKEKFEENSKKWWFKLDPFIYPVKIVIGVLFFIVSIFIFISLIIVNVDRAIFSKCNIMCGFLLEKPVISAFSPFDLILTYSSIIHPADLIIFSIFIIIILIATVTGLANIGIRFFCINLYKVRWRNTVPQGLLTSAAFLMFIVVIFTFSITSFAPQYATFGSQRYLNEKNQWVLCDLNHLKNSSSSPRARALNIDNNEFIRKSNITEPKRYCHMSQISNIIDGVYLRVPIFANIFYLANWIFIISYIISIVIAIFRRPASFARETLDGNESDDEEDEKFLERREKTQRKREITKERIKKRMEQNKIRKQLEEAYDAPDEKIDVGDLDDYKFD